MSLIPGTTWFEELMVGVWSRHWLDWLAVAAMLMALGPIVLFNGPSGLAVDGAGNVYVAEAYGYTVRRVTPGGTVTTIGGVPGLYGYQDGAGTNALFNYALGLALDGLGNLYIADTGNNVVRKGWWSGLSPSVVLVSPRVTLGQLGLDFTIMRGSATSFTLLRSSQIVGPWTVDATGVLETNVPEIWYRFTALPGGDAGFYRVQAH